MLITPIRARCSIGRLGSIRSFSATCTKGGFWLVLPRGSEFADIDASFGSGCRGCDLLLDFQVAVSVTDVTEYSSLPPGLPGSGQYGARVPRD